MLHLAAQPASCAQSNRSSPDADLHAVWALMLCPRRILLAVLGLAHAASGCAACVLHTKEQVCYHLQICMRSGHCSQAPGEYCQRGAGC